MIVLLNMQRPIQNKPLLVAATDEFPEQRFHFRGMMLSRTVFVQGQQIRLRSFLSVCPVSLFFIDLDHPDRGTPGVPWLPSLSLTLGIPAEA